MTVTIPVTPKLGISVIAGSPPNDVSSGQASMMFPFGALSPWSISPGPWDAPVTPAKMPRIEAAAIVMLPLNLCRIVMITSAVSAMIEPDRATRRVQSSKLVHTASVPSSYPFFIWVVTFLLVSFIQKFMYLFFLLKIVKGDIRTNLMAEKNQSLEIIILISIQFAIICPE
jgi:hypothetical protein